MATPLWRRADDGTTLCNACGLFLKLHNRPRPIELKTNIIRSRNRVKVSRDSAKRKTPYDAPATPGEIARQQQHQQQQQQQQQSQQQQHHHLSPYEPHPRTLLTHSQHDDTHAQFTENVFDPQLANPTNSLAQSTNAFDVTQDGVTGDAQSNKLGPSPGQDLETINRELRARVNELEIVNDLFRSRVTELEARQQQYEENAAGDTTVEENLRQTIRIHEQELGRQRVGTFQETIETPTADEGEEITSS